MTPARRYTIFLSYFIMFQQGQNLKKKEIYQLLLKTKAEEHPIKKLDETQTVNFEDATLGMYNGDWDRLGAACVIVDMQHCKPENL